jgi:hypothetical protein
MILISHRGNLNGPNPERENHPDYIWEALRAGYEVEIDVWWVEGKFKLGHDEPQYDFPFRINRKPLQQTYGFIVKTMEALIST